jgi:hypothetical protein
MDDLNDLERGLVTGLLIGEGHFGVDGRRAQLVVGMHVRHEPLLRWVVRLFPRTVLYGPYHYRGRHFMRWRARGAALVCDVLPAIEPVLQTGVDLHVLERLERMKLLARRYMADVREREAGVATYRAPRQKLTAAAWRRVRLGEGAEGGRAALRTGSLRSRLRVRAAFPDGRVVGQLTPS